MSLFDPIDALFGVNGEDPGKGYNEEALAALAGINPPSADDLKAKLQKAVYAGDITPEQAQTYLQDPSLMGGVEGNSTAKAAQLQALSQMQGISTDGGMTPMDKAQLEDIQARSGAAERGSREAIQQNAQARGMGGSGTELLNEMVNGQESATRANEAGLGIAAQARQRALQAMQDSGQLGGQIEGQNFGEQSAKAQAADTINKFNTTNKNATEAANIAAKNAAIARNMETKQNVSDTNTGIANTQAVQNANANQQAFQDQYQKAGGVAGADQNLAAGKSAADQSKRAFEGQLVGAGATAAGGYMAGKAKPNYIISDERKKKDISEVPAKDLDEFMATLDPKKFQYKNPNEPGASEGENVGVMAQDVEKTPVGKTMVKDTGDGKTLDMQKGFGLILAMLGKLHDEIESKKGAA